jgi:hypothetical protein
MCPSRARQRTMLRRMMDVSGGRWIVVLHGEGNELFDCVLQAYDLSGHCGSSAATLPMAESNLGLYVRGGCRCPCARRGEHSATEPLFVRAAARRDSSTRERTRTIRLRAASRLHAVATRARI